ncbi:UNVERIFIED_ORG: mannose/fructose/sorbose-specific phosphotransferase system IIA component [Heyndrickxia coagulans]
MRRFLFATHGDLSKSLIDTVSLIVGDTSNVSYFQMTKNKSGDSAKDELRKILKDKKEEDHFIVLTDMFGGSVCNICTELLMELQNFELLTGVNLPMTLTVLLAGEDTSTEDLISLGLQAGKDGIVHLNQLLASQKGSANDDLFSEN